MLRYKKVGLGIFKTQGRKYENFGNYHFGYVAAPSFPLDIALAEAGRAQGTDNKSKKWSGKPGTTGLPFTGTPPYGDDPNDQYWIRRGYEDYWTAHSSHLPYPIDSFYDCGGGMISQ